MRRSERTRGDLEKKKKNLNPPPLSPPLSPPNNSPALAASANGAGAATVEDKVLCDASCEAALKDAPLVELPSGLSYRDVTTGTGPEPPVGFQVVAHYVAMTPSGKVFDSSLNRGAPYDFRIGAGQVGEGGEGKGG
jgi:FKBP-type peptidyl-prolyl cis-trans isomerase